MWTVGQRELLRLHHKCSWRHHATAIILSKWRGTIPGLLLLLLLEVLIIGIHLPTWRPTRESVELCDDDTNDEWTDDVSKLREQTHTHVHNTRSIENWPRYYKNIRLKDLLKLAKWGEKVISTYSYPVLKLKHFHVCRVYFSQSAMTDYTPAMAHRHSAT